MSSDQPQTTSSSHWLRFHNEAEEHTFGLKFRDGVVAATPFWCRELTGKTEDEARRTFIAKGYTVEAA